MILLLGYDVRRRGGIERLTLQVQHSLESSGRKVVLLCPRRLGAGAAGRWLGRARFLADLALWLPQAERVLSMHALLLAPLRWMAPLGWVASMAGWPGRRQRWYCWLHGLEVWGAALEGVQNDLQRCAGLIASSSFTGERVGERPGAWPPIRVVHPMADLIDGHQPALPMPAAPVLLTVSRMAAEEHYKGHRLVLAALETLRTKGALPADLRWHVVGEGDDRADLEQETARRELQPWVRFLGGLDDQALERELRGCSLLLLPSAYHPGGGGRAAGEGFGIVYLEAAQAGRASIACREGGQTDLILDGVTGWLVDPDPEALAACLATVLADPTVLARAGERARRRSLEAFGADRFRRRLEEALQLSPGNHAREL